MAAWDSLLREATRQLRAAGVERPRFEAGLLLAHVCGVRHEDVLAGLPGPVPGRLAARFRQVVGRRCGGEPFAYITSCKEFMSLEFRVSPEVLVPRPETELLVETAIARLSGLARPMAVEVGTGCGAVAVALAKALPAVLVWAVDISPGAVGVAKDNVARHGVGERVSVVRGDLLAAPGLPPAGSVDVVVANLPYVPAEVFGRLAPEVALHEPRLALDGGEGGLEVISRFLPQAAGYLPPGGACGLECDPGQCTLLTELLRQTGFESTEVCPDLSGRCRVVWGVRGGQVDRRPARPGDRSRL